MDGTELCGQKGRWKLHCFQLGRNEGELLLEVAGAGGGSSEIALLAECKSSRKEIARNKGRNGEKKNALTKKEAVIRRE